MHTPDNIIEKIKPSEAKVILKKLADSDKSIRKQIIKIANALIKQVNWQEIADDVYFSLDNIDVQELWDRSGANRFGYTSPEDMAFEMVEEELEPFNNEFQRLCDLKLKKEANQYCKGILKGIYQYAQESTSEFKDWATDIPGECHSAQLDEWHKKFPEVSEKNKMMIFLEKECGGWK